MRSGSQRSGSDGSPTWETVGETHREKEPPPSGEDRGGQRALQERDRKAESVRGGQATGSNKCGWGVAGNAGEEHRVGLADSEPGSPVLRPGCRTSGALKEGILNWDSQADFRAPWNPPKLRGAVAGGCGLHGRPDPPAQNPRATF